MTKFPNIRVTKQFSFDMAHALYGYDGPCKNIHGHTYRLSVTLIGKQICDEKSPKLGMVIDFTDFKKIVQEKIICVFDHTLVLKANSPHAQIEGLNQQFERIIYTDYQPSCENLLINFVERIYPYLPENISLHSVKLEETPTSYAEWFQEDNLG